VGSKGIHVALPPDPLARLDAWIEAQPDPKPSRPEAIRRLLEKALSSKPQRENRMRDS
jgi:metal-responsive CopG/Arc/MetJ family transcriptional regulator